MCDTPGLWIRGMAEKRARGLIAPGFDAEISYRAEGMPLYIYDEGTEKLVDRNPFRHVFVMFNAPDFCNYKNNPELQMAWRQQLEVYAKTGAEILYCSDASSRGLWFPEKEDWETETSEPITLEEAVTRYAPGVARSNNVRKILIA